MMKKFIGCLLGFAALMTQVSALQAAEVEVKWTNPDKYTDIDAGEEHRKHFKARVFKSFEEHFVKMAALLPAQHKLVLDITDVDLAGDVNFGGTRRIRIVKELFFPRLEFNYQLLNADNSVVKSAEVALKDMSFLMHSGLKYRSKSFGYEKEMFDKWFYNTFANELVK
ncbi:Protein of unknown function [Colwellia chukchiensis]|uniref:DUF3016 domain-containing protein n=1 Tax=Colwellia chukchiensis TaxID=641665 RepID=A0A1H7N8S7_9GAMM|nr:DUF3016 domain-containing protein [Colwellia chukchiensis]SEL19669.1 Protein of unknown function [Colwellia chukchiensis]